MIINTASSVIIIVRRRHRRLRRRRVRVSADGREARVVFDGGGADDVPRERRAAVRARSRRLYRAAREGRLDGAQLVAHEQRGEREGARGAGRHLFLLCWSSRAVNSRGGAF